MDNKFRMNFFPFDPFAFEDGKHNDLEKCGKKS